MSVDSNYKFRKIVTLSACLLVASAVTGCQTTGNSMKGDPFVTNSTTPVQASFKATQAAAARWQKDTGNINTGMAYIQQLQLLKQNRQVVAVLAELVSKNPKNPKLLAYYGKKLGAEGQSKDGERWLREAIVNGQRDWKTYSALGSMLDQQGRYKEARQQYQLALQQRPNEIKVYNNIGMSNALEGNLKKAESTLRQASQMPGAETEPRIRQNLALVVALQGRFNESRDIASRDLPTADVDANMAYIQKMMKQKNNWQSLQKKS